MNIENVKNQWQSYLPDEQPSEASLMASCKEVEKHARDRELFGSIAFVLLIAFLIALNTMMYLMQADMAAVMVVASWILVIVINTVRLLALKTKRPGITLAVNEYFSQKKAIIEKEIQYYSTLWLWLTLPLGVGMVILLSIMPTLNSMTFVSFCGAYILCAGYGHHYCKKRIAETYLPLVNQLS